MTTSSGTLPENQVQAMFDRIARVYDRMNSVMTVGLDRRWRERAADLARVGPGSTALDVATGTGDLAIELRSRGAEVTGLDFSEEMLGLARREGAGHRLALGQRARAALRRRRVRRGHGGLRRAQLRRPRPGPGGDGAGGRARRAGGGAGDDHAAAAAAVVVLPAVVRPPGAAAGAPGGRPRRLHLPAQLRPPLPAAPRGWPPRWHAAGLDDVRWVLTAGRDHRPALGYGGSA